jgi:hypothetical protein
MIRANWRLSLVACAATAFASQLAAESVRLKAEIPFEFHMGTSILPAGSYTVTAEPGKGFAEVQNNTGKERAYVMVYPTQRGQTGGDSTLTFHRYGDKYFIAEIQPGWSAGGYQVLRSHAEKEAVFSAGMPQRYVIVAHR